jgi:hypothetical protein
MANTRPWDPQFTVPIERRYRGLWTSLAAVCARHRTTPTIGREYFGRSLNPARYRPLTRCLLASIGLHAVAVLLIPRVSANYDPARQVPEPNERIYYVASLLQRRATLPRVRSAGVQGEGPRIPKIPNIPTLAPKLPAVGTEASRPNLSIFSNPLRPDNLRQTIIQPSSPPALRITQDLRLPDVVLGNAATEPRAPIEAPLSAPRRTQANRQQNQDVDASGISGQPPGFEVAMLGPTAEQPRLPVPLGPMGAPRGNGRSTGYSDGVPDLTGGEAQGGGGGLMIIGVDPDGAASLVALPPGNRFGAFSVSPGGAGGSGTGGGANTAGGGTGSTGAGTGTAGVGSDRAGIGTGRGDSGRGRDEIGSGPVSVEERGGATPDPGRLPSNVVAEAMILPVITAPHIRTNALTVSTGPIGGGGLGVYGALDCGKIYTVFVPMPATAWTLEYCVQDSAAAKRSGATSQAPAGAVVHLEQGLVAPDALVKFDFLRLPVSEDKLHKMIVLKGFIRENGSVDGLQVYQGLLPEMDEAALAALSRWKFTPAMRGGKALAVEILVGIPNVSSAVTSKP